MAAKTHKSWWMGEERVQLRLLPPKQISHRHFKNLVFQHPALRLCEGISASAGFLKIRFKFWK